MNDPVNPNAAQIEFWNGPSGQQWAKNQAAMDANLKPFADAAIELAQVQSGERILDIGCGAGGTTLALAVSAGASGHVLGVDVSKPMVDLARTRATSASDEGKPFPHFEIADASEYDFTAAPADLLFSRFGVMFFADPVAAFTNLRKGLRSGGRVAFICWQSMAENDFFAVPMKAALTVLPTPPAAPANAPGPFAFADKDNLDNILSEAGFNNINIESLALDMNVGHGKGIEAACKEVINTGPLSRLTSNISPDQRAAVNDKVMAALQAYETNGNIMLRTRTWLVSAINA